MVEKGVHTAVSVSQKNDSFDAGRQAALGLSCSPNLVVVYSTIHYKDWGGFKELLAGIYSVLPEETIIVGGTVAGFIAPQGCYSRGVALFGISSNDLDLVVSISKNIKRNPERAAVECAEEIRDKLRLSRYKNKFLLTHPSGVTTPKIPGYPKNIRVINNKLISKLLIYGLHLSLILLQKGPGREEVIIEKLSEILPEYKILGGSFVDDNKGYSNYQFFNKEVGTNWLITVGIATDLEIDINSSLGLRKTNKLLKIDKKSTFDLVIERINGKKAVDAIVETLNLPDINSKNILKKTFYSPIGYEFKGKQYISVIAFIFGNSIMVTPKMRGDKAYIMTTSGKDLINAVDENLSKTKGKNICFGLISSCLVRLETLGSQVYEVHKKLKEHFGEKPFIQVYLVGEDIYSKELGARRIAESYNSAIFYQK